MTITGNRNTNEAHSSKIHERMVSSRTELVTREGGEVEIDGLGL